ncbi:hypothetical protein ACP4J4_01830 [Aureimonas ureilytica]|uniref:hypothetical protein n=1 Tax=Aureimonas ureilytica TaxID=401562 RepID=UPI003CF4F9DF
MNALVPIAPAKPACASCRFFQALPFHPMTNYLIEREDGTILRYRRVVGQCRARPPTPQPYNGNPFTDTTEGIWPVVLGQDWCGCHETPAG